MRFLSNQCHSIFIADLGNNKLDIIFNITLCCVDRATSRSARTTFQYQYQVQCHDQIICKRQTNETQTRFNVSQAYSNTAAALLLQFTDVLVMLTLTLTITHGVNPIDKFFLLYLISKAQFFSTRDQSIGKLFQQNDIQTHYTLYTLMEAAINKKTVEYLYLLAYNFICGYSLISLKLKI